MCSEMHTQKMCANKTSNKIQLHKIHACWSKHRTGGTTNDRIYLEVTTDGAQLLWLCAT